MNPSRDHDIEVLLFRATKHSAHTCTFRSSSQEIINELIYALSHSHAENKLLKSLMNKEETK